MRIVSLMKLLLPLIVVAILNNPRASAQIAYGYSSITIGPSSVTSHSETDLDYIAEYYYYTETDAYLWANSSLADSGSSYADDVNLSTSTDVNTTYWIQTNHSLIAFSGFDTLDFTENGGGWYGSSMMVSAYGENPFAPSPVFLGTTNDSGDTNGSPPSLSCSGGGVDESSYGTEVRGTTGYVILYGCNFTTPYGDTYISSSFGSPAYVSDSQVNLYYEIPTNTASGTLANDIGISTPYGSTSADFHVYDCPLSLTSTAGTLQAGGATSSSFSVYGSCLGTNPSVSVNFQGTNYTATGSGTDTAYTGSVLLAASPTSGTASITVGASSLSGGLFFQHGSETQSGGTSIGVSATPIPSITGVSGGPFSAGHTYSGAAISGTNLGTQGSVSVDSGSFSISSWGSSIGGTLTLPQNDTNTSLAVRVTPYNGLQSAPYNVTLGCGDIRNSIIYEYVAHTVDLTPQCSWFTQSASAPHFSYSELTVASGESWALIREPLVISGASYGLEEWRAQLGGVPQTINSGYRGPDHNAAIGGASHSRHMHGDAIDLNNSTRTQAEYDTKSTAASNANADYIEPVTGPCGLGCVHADWRNHAGSYQ